MLRKPSTARCPTPFQHVCVDVSGDRNGAVAEELGHDTDVHSGSEPQRPGAMPQPVEGQLRERFTLPATSADSRSFGCQLRMPRPPLAKSLRTVACPCCLPASRLIASPHQSKSASSVVFAARDDGSVNQPHGPVSIPWRSAQTSRPSVSTVRLTTGRPGFADIHRRTRFRRSTARCKVVALLLDRFGTRGRRQAE